MPRSIRSRRRGEPDLGSPPLVKMQHMKTSGVACALNETIDENDAELQQAATEASAAKTKVSTVKQKQQSNAGKDGRKRKRTAGDLPSDAGDDKENNGVLLKRLAKRKKGLALKPLAEREPSASQVSNANSTQESPPIFAYKQGKTALKARKLRKEKQETHVADQKRLEDMATFFASLDDEKLVYL